MSIFGAKMGTWWVQSKKDSRWNKSGRGNGLVSSGGPKEMHDWIEECKKNFGNAPEDVEYGFVKD